VSQCTPPSTTIKGKNAQKKMIDPREEKKENIDYSVTSRHYYRLYRHENDN
jgi:hypothetical protein